MTTPSGSRTDSASNSDREDDGATERDDPKARSMRQVWLAMRDEAPPEGGMAELLAAARAKADTMRAAPAPWQRVAQWLRRPQALAFAAVIVVVGGAVIVGRRVDSVPAADVATEAPGGPGGDRRGPDAETVARGVAGATGGPAHQAEAAVVRAGSAGDEVVTLSEESHPPGASPPHPARATPGARPAPALVDGTAPVRPEQAPVTGEGTGGGMQGAPATPETERATPTSELDLAVRKAAREGERPVPPALSRVVPASRQDRPSATVPAPPRDGTGSRTVDDSIAPSNEASNKASIDGDASKSSDRSERNETNRLPARPEATIEPLYQQCEAAAERGDCVAVRRLVGRITTRDRGYRARLGRDSAVARCLTNAPGL